MGHKIFGAFPILCIAGSKIYITVRAFYKPISETFAPYFRTQNMVSFKEV